MKTKNKLLLFVCLGLVLALSGVVKSDLSSFGQSECALQDQQARLAFVGAVLPAVTEFQIVDFQDFSLENFPIAQGVDGAQTIAMALTPKQIRQSGFATQVYARTATGVSVDSVAVPVAGAYQGVSLDNPDNSLISLYVTDSFVSGFFITDVESTSAPWYFIEPLRPLLQTQQWVLANSGLQEIISACFSASAHIVYDALKTDAQIDLGAGPGDGQELTSQLGVDRPVHNESSRTLVQRESADLNNARLAAQTILPTVPLVAVADSAFYALYDHTVDDKTWWQAQEEVLNLVNEFYQQQLGVALEVHTLEAWSQGGPGSALADFDGDGLPELDVATMICHFAQGYPEAPVVHSHAEGDGTPTVAHLFTGQQLNATPVNNLETASDAGCCFCEQSCLGDAATFIGAAEGIGGLWNRFADNCFEGVAPNPGAHHSVSQHATKLVGLPEPGTLETLTGQSGEIIADAGCCFCEDGCSGLPPKSNYQGLLYQRFLLVAHEIGHNLGAHHDVEGVGIMSSSLFNGTPFALSDSSKAAMLQTLIRP